MSIPLTQLGARAFNHSAADDVEAEYDRLRDLARDEARKRNACFDDAHNAYERGDGAAAKSLSNEGKSHGRKMDDYNRQASDYIFRENNAPGRVDSDEIDLHGQFVEEAEDILEDRIKAGKSRGDTHLHVIVGKGNHSAGNVQKIKPRVEKVCKDLRLKYHTEDNEGRMYIDFGTGDGDHSGQQHGGQSGGHSGQHGGQSHGGQQHHGGKDDDVVADLIGACLPKVLAKCCIVM